MTTAYKEEIVCSVSARACALAWLNTFLATGSEAEKPTLYQTLSLEWYESGLHLIATDGTHLYRTWVKAVIAEGAKWPTLGEAPLRSVIIMDADGFGAGFMRALLRVTSDERYADEQLTIQTSQGDDGATIALGEEFMTERLVLRACGQRIDLRLHEGKYPDWRQARLGVDEAERVPGMTVSKRALATLAKLKGVEAVDMDFFGEARHIIIRGRGLTDADVLGIVMPMRRSEKAVDDGAPRKRQEPPQRDAFGESAADEGENSTAPAFGGASFRTDNPIAEAGFIAQGWWKCICGWVLSPSAARCEHPETSFAGALAYPKPETASDHAAQDVGLAMRREHLDPPPPKLTSDAVQEMRAAAEAPAPKRGKRTVTTPAGQEASV